MQEKEKFSSRLRVISVKLTKLRELMKEEDINREKQAKMEELLQRLISEEKKTSLKISELMKDINADDNATVEVLGEIAPGTMIEICQVAMFIDKSMRNVRIRLDKNSRMLVSETL
jgi:hypothetical protein